MERAGLLIGLDGQAGSQADDDAISVAEQGSPTYQAPPPAWPGARDVGLQQSPEIPEWSRPGLWRAAKLAFAVGLAFSGIAVTMSGYRSYIARGDAAGSSIQLIGGYSQSSWSNSADEVPDPLAPVGESHSENSFSGHSDYDSNSVPDPLSPGESKTHGPTGFVREDDSEVNHVSHSSLHHSYNIGPNHASGSSYGGVTHHFAIGPVSYEDLTTKTSTITGTTTSTTLTTTNGPVGDKPFLFCWSHIQLGSYEEALIKFQLSSKASIFACNGYAVITTEKKLLGEHHGKEVYTWANPAPPVSMGQYGVNGATTNSFLNTQTFLQAWDSLLSSKRLWPYDFVVKVDPDAVFFPDRARNHVRAFTGQAVYFANCGKFGGEAKLYGSIEIFSVPAMGAYQDRREECKRLPWHGWGEDYFMQHCMDMIGVRYVADTNQVGDKRCGWASCNDWQKVAFHDFKDPKAWEACFNQAIGK